MTNAIVTAEAILPSFMIDPWCYQQADLSAMRVKFLFDSLYEIGQVMINFATANSPVLDQMHATI